MSTQHELYLAGLQSQIDDARGKRGKAIFYIIVVAAITVFGLVGVAIDYFTTYKGIESNQFTDILTFTIRDYAFDFVSLSAAGVCIGLQFFSIAKMQDSIKPGYNTLTAFWSHLWRKADDEEIFFKLGQFQAYLVLFILCFMFNTYTQTEYMISPVATWYASLFFSLSFCTIGSEIATSTAAPYISISWNRFVAYGKEIEILEARLAQAKGNHTKAPQAPQQSQQAQQQSKKNKGNNQQPQRPQHSQPQPNQQTQQRPQAQQPQQHSQELAEMLAKIKAGQTTNIND